MKRDKKITETDLESDVKARMKRTIELCEVAEEIMLQNLRRRHPEATEAEIEERYRAWVYKKASEGDPPHLRRSTRRLQ